MNRFANGFIDWLMLGTIVVVFASAFYVAFTRDSDFLGFVLALVGCAAVWVWGEMGP